MGFREGWNARMLEFGQRIVTLIEEEFSDLTSIDIMRAMCGTMASILFAMAQHKGPLRPMILQAGATAIKADLDGNIAGLDARFTADEEETFASKVAAKLAEDDGTIH